MALSIVHDNAMTLQTLDSNLHNYSNQELQQILRIAVGYSTYILKIYLNILKNQEREWKCLKTIHERCSNSVIFIQMLVDEALTNKTQIQKKKNFE